MIEDNNATYSELLSYYQPRKIQSEENFRYAKQLLNELSAKDTLNEAQSNLLYLLEVLIKDYEIKNIISKWKEVFDYLKDN
jgi:hypothetical protein